MGVGELDSKTTEMLDALKNRINSAEAKLDAWERGEVEKGAKYGKTLEAEVGKLRAEFLESIKKFAPAAGDGAAKHWYDWFFE